MNQKTVFWVLALMFLFTANMPAAELTTVPLIAPSIEVTSSELKETATAFSRWLRQDNVPNRINFRTRSGFVLLRKEAIIFLKIDVKSGDLILHYRQEGQIRKVSIQASLASVLDKLNAFPFLDTYMELENKERIIQLFSSNIQIKERLGNNASLIHLKATIFQLSQETLHQTQLLLTHRTNGLGLGQVSISKDLDNQYIRMEIPGAKNPERIREMLLATASLEFWDTYKVTNYWKD